MAKLPRPCAYLLLACTLSAAFALGSPVQAQETSAGPRVVYVIGGVGGIENLHNCVRWALNEAHVRCEVRDFLWTHGKGKILKDLQDHRYLEQKAEQLAGEVRALRREDAQRPIYFIARSGGAALALAAAARLPAASLERIILLSPAVSPGFDLAPALRATRNEIVSFCSNFDWYFSFILGWDTTMEIRGTKLFGTADRAYGPSAGETGFVKPFPGDSETRALYRRLVEVRWSPAMLLTGNAGGHLGNTVPLFLLREVVPWIQF